MQAAGGRQSSMLGFNNRSPAQLVSQTQAGGHKSLSGSGVAVPAVFETIIPRHCLQKKTVPNSEALHIYGTVSTKFR